MIIKGDNGQMTVRESLFWDVSKESLDPERNRQLIIERIITRGNLDEFSALLHFYGLKKIRNTLKNIPVLDKKSRNLVMVFFNLGEKELACCKKRL